MVKGFVKLALVVPKLKICDIDFNLCEIKNQINVAVQNGAKIIAFPEMSLCGYTCQDMLLYGDVQSKQLEALQELCNFSKNIDACILVGLALKSFDKLFNCAVVICKGEIKGVVPKTNQTTKSEIRWFSNGCENQSEIELFGIFVPFGKNLVFKICEDCSFAIEVGNNLLSPNNTNDELASLGANIIINMTATAEYMGGEEIRKNAIQIQSLKTKSAYAFLSSGVNESSTDFLYGGKAYIFENGEELLSSKGFNFESEISYADVDYEYLTSERICNKNSSGETTVRQIDAQLNLVEYEIDRQYKKFPFVPTQNKLKNECENVLSLQAYSLCKRMLATKSKKLILGVSGGLDSTLALFVCYKATQILNLPKENIFALTMPGFGTTSRTYNNALSLMKELGVTQKEIDITKVCLQHFEDIELKEVNSVAYENAQARERTQILFDFANNLGEALVVGTGDLSELVLGWCTFNGDHISGYSVNAGVPKTLIKHIIETFAKNENNQALINTVQDIIQSPISPELLAVANAEQGQQTEEIIGKYELNDFFMYHFLKRKSKAEKIVYLASKTFNLQPANVAKQLENFIKRFIANQFKRSCLPDGVQICDISISPRGGLVLASDIECGFVSNLIKGENV